jgi:hypothetical protein
MGPWGAQTWAHHGRGSSSEPHGPMGGRNLGPSWAGLKFDPRGPMKSPNLGPSWAGLKSGPSWAHGGPKLGPIMGGAKAWALMGLWGHKLGPIMNGGDALFVIKCDAICEHRRGSWPAAEYDYIIPSGPYLLRWAAPAWLATAVPGPLSPATRPLMGLGTSGDRRPGVHGPRNKNKASRAKRVASVFYFPPEARAI